MAQEIKSWNNGIVEDQSGSTLPTVNADDNGKTLQVVNGQWDKGGKIPQLPTPAVGDIGKIVGAVSDGESGAEYGLIDAPSDIYILECNYSTASSSFSFLEGESERLLSAIEAGKVIVLKLDGYTGYSNSPTIIGIGSVMAGYSSAWAQVQFDIVSTNGVGGTFNAFAHQVGIQSVAGTMSGTVYTNKLAFAT